MKLTEKELENLSKHMSYILRHNPDEVGGLNDNGQTTVVKLMTALGCSREVVLQLIESDSKSRFAMDGELVWAVQGHSITGLNIDQELLTEVPARLWHGTKTRAMKSIMKKGLIPNGRTMVHLSSDRETAQNVADRRLGSSTILIVDTHAMVQEGIKFFRAKNGVILTEHVPAKFLKEETE